MAEEEQFNSPTLIELSTWEAVHCDRWLCAEFAVYKFSCRSPYPDYQGVHHRVEYACTWEHAQLHAEDLWGIGYDIH